MIAPWLSPLRPADRVGAVIARTPEFAWAFRFLHTFPEASLALVGSSVRDAILGHVSQTAHLLISSPHIHPAKIDHWMQSTPVPKFFTLHFSSQPKENFLSERIFTPNALAYDIAEGTLSDPFHGIDALQQGLLTTVPDAHTHFRTHPHEAFRALRLSAQLGISPAPHVWRAAVTYIPYANHLTTNEEGFATYKTPRTHLVREGLLALKHGMYGWELFSRARATPLAFPHLAQSSAHELAELHLASVHDAAVRSRFNATPLSDNLTTAALFNHHSDRAHHYKLHAHHMHHAGVLHPQLNFSHNDVAQTLAKAHALLTENPALWPLSRTEKVLLGEDGNEALSLAHIATLHDRSLYDQSQHIARAALTRDELVRDIRPRHLLSGRDLLPLGLSSGPHIRTYLNRVRDEQLKGDLATKEEALAYLRTLLHAH